jgi:hypothetical protein
MANKRLERTNPDLLMSNLRGELGELVTTWLLLRHFMAESTKFRSPDSAEDLANRQLAFLWLLTEKLRNDLIGQLSELAYKKIGRTNFFFASRKLTVCESEVEEFETFVVSNQLRAKRNQEIAHRQQPEHWFEDRPIRIPYPTLVKATAMALRLMKRLDRAALGPAAPFLWREVRKKRYELSGSPRATYMLVPFMRLSDADRIRVVQAEQAEGKVVWSEIETMIDGQPARVLVCKEWGLLWLGNRWVPLAQYPLQKIEAITFGSKEQTQPPSTKDSPDA